MCSNWQQATARRRLDVEEIFSRHVATHDGVRGITPGIQPSMKCCSLRVKGGAMQEVFQFPASTPVRASIPAICAATW